MLVLLVNLSTSVLASNLTYDPNGNQISQQASPALAPTIVKGPSNVLLTTGATVRFTVVASGTGPISYQWRHNGAPLNGQTRDVLEVSGLAMNLSSYGDYTVTVSNGHGGVTSGAATVLPDSNGNSLPDSWEMQHFGNLNQKREGDFDGDQISNLDEYLLGSSPASINRYLRSAGTWYYHELNPVSSWTATSVIGQPFQFQTAATGNASAFAATGLPPGLSIHPATGLLSGTPTQAGTYVLNLTASTIYGPATGTLTLNVQEVVAWGYNGSGQTNVPVGLTNVVALAGGGAHSLALKSDGTITGWGYNGYAQINIPAGLNTAVAVAAGTYHSLALKSDGTVIGWGGNSDGQTSIPAGLSGVAAIAACNSHSFALKSDGTVVGWGNNGYGQVTIPGGLSTVVAISAGDQHGLALKADGTVAAWGGNSNNQLNIPAGLANVIAISAGSYHNLALKADGSVVAWGSSANGRTTVPAAALGGVVAIAAGGAHSLALKADGSLVSWGYNSDGQTTIPPGLVKSVAIAAGANHSLALATIDPGIITPTIISPAFALGSIISGFRYQISATQAATTFGATGLPAGLQINATTGLITGTPTAYGTFTVTITAGNAHGTAQRTLSITINRPLPLIYSPATAVAIVGNSFSYQIQGANSPTSYSATGLPAGLSLNTQTGLISGTSHQGGSFAVTLSATNAHGTETLELSLQVQEVVAWGYNYEGQATVPPGLNNVVAIAAGVYHSLALKGDGTVAGWGSSGSAQSTPPAGLNTVEAIAAGEQHSVALKADGTVVAWGYNGNGQTTVPAGLSGVVAIAACENHTLALKSDGTVVGWGYNSNGQLNAPGGLNTVVAIGTGEYHSLALKADGTVVVWGNNSYNQLNVPAGLANVVAISAGALHNIALKTDGSVVAWGYNSNSRITVPAAAQTGVVAISANGAHNLALKADGSIVTWGYNGYGQTTVPAGLTKSIAIAAGNNHSLALATSIPGVVSPAIISPGFALGSTTAAFFYRITGTQGATTFGASGLPAGLTINTATGVISGTPTVYGTFSVTVTAGNAFGTTQKTLSITINRPLPLIYSPNPALALLNHSFSYQLQASNNPTGYTATGLPAGLTFNAQTGLVSGTPLQSGTFTVALSATNAHGTQSVDLSLQVSEVVAWGNNADGQSTIPAGLSQVMALAAGTYHTLALKADGTVTAWGYGGNGQTSVPAGLNSAVAIAAGDRHSLALKADGTVVAWGYNSNGQATVPAGLGGVVAIAASSSHSLALKSDGTVVGWGYNGYAQLTPPAGLDTAVAIGTGDRHSLALKADGTVVAWGDNSYNQLNIPAGLANVAAISCGLFHNVVLKTDGSVLAWGYDSSGRITVPAAGQTGVVAVAAGGAHSLAVKADGSLVSWGYNGYAQTTLPAGLNLVAAVSGGGNHSLALVRHPPSAPQIAPPQPPVGVRGSPYHFQLMVRHAPTSLSITGLPAGLQLDSQTRRITGVPTVAGTFAVELTASNGLGSTEADFQLTINDPLLELTSAPLTEGEVGQAFSNQFTTAQPASNFRIEGLPPGLVFDPATATLSGTPTQVGAFTVMLQATTANGNAIRSWTLNIQPAFDPSLSPVSPLVFTHGGDARWRLQPDRTPPGTHPVARSGNINHSQQTWIETTITGPGVLTFWWSVSSESGYDYLEFRTNGTLRDRIAGAVDWQLKSYTFTSGTHTLRWRYMKDGSAVSGADTAWLSEVNFKGANSPDNAFLSGLNLSSGSLSPAFAPGITDYTATVPGASLTVTPVPMNTSVTQQVRVNNGSFATVPVGSASAPLPLNVGDNTIEVKITAPNGTTIMSYFIEATRVLSSNANLASLAVPGATLSPAFNASVTNYTATVGHTVTTASLTAAGASEVAQLSQTPAGAVPLVFGSNSIQLTVTAEDGTLKTYTVNVVRLRSSNADLASLAITGGTLVPAFDPAVTTYTAHVPYASASTEVAAAVADATASMQQSPASPMPLQVGANTAGVTVTAQDGTTVKTYTITINRASNTNANLASLQVAGAVLTPAFNPAVTNYAATVGNAVTSGLVTATAEAEVTSILQTPAGPAALSVGTTSVSVTVTALDGVTVKTYIVAITRTAADKAKPTLKITAPATPVVTGPFTISGLVKDATPLTSLTVKLNGTALPLAAPITFIANKDIAWTVSNAQPQEGLNTILVEAVDVNGNRSELRSTVERRHVLTLWRDVPAAQALKPDTVGTLAFAALPAKNATSLTKTLTSQFNHVTPGTQVTVTAAAKSGFLFSHWSGLPVGTQIAGNVITCTMPSAPVNVRAVFLANPFVVAGSSAPVLPSGAAPVFQGLLRPSSNENDNGKVGLVSVTLTPSTGSLSGKISMDGKIVPFTAVAQANGSVWFKGTKNLAAAFTFTGRTTDRLYTVFMTWTSAGFVTTVYGPSGLTSSGTARPPIYSRTQPVTSTSGMLNSKTQGLYTVAFLAQTQADRDLDEFPNGTGYATLPLNTDGSFKVTGVLSDGTKITAASFLTYGNVGAMFIQLPSPGASTKNGSLAGNFIFSPSSQSDISAPDLRWFRPTAESRPNTAQLYRSGWPEGISLETIGALYSITQTSQMSLGLNSLGDARLLFGSGQLTSNIHVTNFSIQGNKIVRLSPQDKTWTLTLLPTTGLFSGTFTPNWPNPAKSMPVYQGIILQKGSRQGGWGFFLSNRAGDLAPESGWISLGNP